MNKNLAKILCRTTTFLRNSEKHFCVIPAGAAAYLLKYIQKRPCQSRKLAQMVKKRGKTGRTFRQNQEKTAETRQERLDKG